MNPMVPGLTGDKMSSSEENSKIDLLDKPERVAAKIQSAFCVEGETKGNGILAFAKQVIFPASELSPSFVGPGLGVITDGAECHFDSFVDLEKAFEAKRVRAKDLKEAVTDAVNRLLAPIQAKF